MSSTNESKKVLFVEDDPIIAGIYQKVFAKANYEFEQSVDGRDALAKLESFQPDILILDLVLPVMDGLDVLRRLRDRETGERLPVIVFSNAYQTSMIDSAWKEGADAVLIKANTSRDKLLATTARLLAVENVNPESTSPAPDSDTEWPDLSTWLGQCRESQEAVVSSPESAQRSGGLENLTRTAGRIVGAAGVLGKRLPACLAEAYHALLEEAQAHPEKLSDSVLRTSAKTIELLKRIDHSTGESAFAPLNGRRVLALAPESDTLRRGIDLINKQECEVVRVTDLETVSDAGDGYDLALVDTSLLATENEQLISQLQGLERVAKRLILMVEEAPPAAGGEESRRDFIVKPFSPTELNLSVFVNLLN